MKHEGVRQRLRVGDAIAVERYHRGGLEDADGPRRRDFAELAFRLRRRWSGSLPDTEPAHLSLHLAPLDQSFTLYS